MAAAQRDIKPTGYTDKQTARVMTVDKERSRIECALRDGAMVYVAIWETPDVFRWPKTGEIWTIRKDSGIWRLDSQTQTPGSGDSDGPILLGDMEEGETRILGDVVHLNEVSTDLVRTSDSSPWITPTLQNSWTKYGDAAFASVAYRKDVTGKITLRGFVLKASGAAGTTIFTLPTGFRPLKHQMWPCQNSSGIERVDVRSTGAVIYQGAQAALTWLSLDPISFWTD